MILITPNWPAQPWFNQILELCIANPLLLPPTEALLLDPQGQEHPLIRNRTLGLVAWKVSGAAYLQRAYQLGLQNLSLEHEEVALSLIMNRPGESGYAGVVNGKLIPLLAI